MACTIDFIEYICEQIEELGTVFHRKMFGEYLIYLNGKPVIIACDNTAYIKIIPETESIMHEAERGFPYEGAKEHFILDPDNKNLTVKVVSILEKTLPFPKPRKRKHKQTILST